jgi:hypothetical protein
MNSKEHQRQGTSAHVYFMFQEMDVTKKGKPEQSLNEIVNGQLL